LLICGGGNLGDKTRLAPEKDGMARIDDDFVLGRRAADRARTGYDAHAYHLWV
jgi:hypothetical protein